MKREIKNCKKCGHEAMINSGSGQSAFDATATVKCRHCGRYLFYSAWCVSKESWEELKNAAIEGWNAGQTGGYEKENMPPFQFVKKYK